ncbi:DUF1854 domain-containing protein [Dechloromonas sp. A34]|uniref:cyanophycin metabolism-associated DUF1854 family protein n=1 Tax=Dechloromonas sp. A34 TaxID=447588 RepID=UPI002248AE6A|nr:DUF1854 domain-containing protein [Dechloromonas sp. A34]
MTTPNFTLSRNAFGQLILTTANGESHVGIIPVRAFPIAAPDEGIALVSADGHEAGWIDRIADLPPAIGQLIEEELASREFVPEIERIVEVSSFACPSTWQVVTDRGDAALVLKGEEDIRRLTQTRLIIADTHGIEFLIRDTGKLDRHSRKLLDRFL